MTTKRKYGLGSVYTETTRTITEGAKAIGNMAEAGRILSDNAVRESAFMSIESTLERANDWGLAGPREDGTTTPEDVTKAMTSINKLVDVIRG